MDLNSSTTDSLGPADAIISKYYTLETELRCLPPLTAHTLASVLSGDNEWRKLMAIIPKRWSSPEFSTDVLLDWEIAVAVDGLKYNNKDIIRIECEFWWPGESRLHAEILFADWFNSEGDEQLPTLGMLLQLCVNLEFFAAADCVAQMIPYEPPPKRPKLKGDSLKNSPFLRHVLGNMVNITTKCRWHKDAELDSEGELEPHAVWHTHFFKWKWNKERQVYIRIEVNKIIEKTNEFTTLVTWHYNT